MPSEATLATRVGSPLQSIPAAGILTTVYTVPTGYTVEVPSAQVCNQSAGISRFWISVAPGGAVDATSQYLYFNLPILEGYDSFKFDVGMLLNQGDQIRVKSDNGLVSFTFYNKVTSQLGNVI